MRQSLRLTKRDAALAAIGGAVCGLCIGCGRAFYTHGGHLELASPSLWLSVLVVALAAAVAISAGFVAYDLIQAHGWSRRISRAVTDASPGLRRLALTGVTALLWIPAFLALYPGNYSSDAPLQATIFLNEGVVDLHWPAVHTLLLADFLSLGNTMLGSFNAGVSLFVCAQALVLALALAYSADRLMAWGAPLLIVCITWLLVVLNPTIQTYAFTTAKDSLFTAFFLITFVKCTDIVRRGLQKRSEDCERSTNGKPGGERLQRLRPAHLADFALLAFVALLMCLLRKQGLVVIVLLAILALMAMRNSTGAALLVTAGVVVAGYFAVGVAVDMAYPVRADSAREVLSVPSQQMVRTYMVDHGTLSQEERDAITRYYDEGMLEGGRTSTRPWEGMPGIGSYYEREQGVGYLEPVSDPAKAALREDAYASDKLGYFSTWLSLLPEHAQAYLDAFAWGTIGYVYPSSAIVNRWSNLSPFNEFGVTIDVGGAENQVLDYNESSMLPRYRDWLLAASVDLFAGCTPLTVWVHPASFFFVALGSLLLSIRTRKREAILALLMPALYWLSLLLGPVMCVRYAMPLMVCTAFVACLPFCASRGQNPRHAHSTSKHAEPGTKRGL